jgi:hypothetical protein
MRARVHLGFDLVQAGLGVRRPEDITPSVLTVMIGDQVARGWMRLAQD